MPAKVKKVSGGYQVATPNAIHAKKTTHEKAVRQQRLLNAIDHGFIPKGAPRKVRHSPTMTEYDHKKQHSMNGVTIEHGKCL